MSELARRRHEQEGFVDPSDLTPPEVLDMFFSELRHPSIGAYSSKELSKFISKHLTSSGENELSHDQLRWQARMAELMIDAAGVDDKTFDQWLNDEPFVTAYTAIRKIVSSKHRSEKEAERTALTEVWNLRAGVLNRDEVDSAQDDEWLRLINRLTPAD